jgi:hypothetical protein
VKSKLKEKIAMEVWKDRENMKEQDANSPVGSGSEASGKAVPVQSVCSIYGREQIAITLMLPI